MDCRLKYTTDIIEDIYSIAGVGRTSATPIKHNSLLLPVGGKDTNNKSLSSKNNTYFWAQTIQNKVNSKYNSDVFGNIIEIDNVSNDKGTIINITVPKKLVDAYEVKHGDKTMENFYKEHEARMLEGNQKIDDEGNVVYQTGTVGKKNQQLDILLKEFLSLNNISLEYYDTLLGKYNGDYIGVYDAIKKTIAINQNKEGIDTLPEEVAHSLVEALGEDDFLVNKALHLIGKTNYKDNLDPEYIKLYKNNSTALKKEYLGKLIADVLVNKFEPTSKEELSLLDTILKLIKKFVGLFKTNDRIDQLDTIVGELADKIVNLEKIVPTGAVNPSTTSYFQVNSKKTVNPEHKEQYVYFKRRLGEIAKNMAKYDETSDKYIELKAEYDKINKAIEELVDSGNSQIIIDLGNELMDNIDNKFISSLESGKKVKPKDMVYAMQTLKAFDNYVGLRDKAGSLLKRLEPFTGTFTLDLINEHRTEEEELTMADIESQKIDINIATKSFGALADLGNYIARTIGSVIKEAQNKISTMNKKLTSEIKKEVDALREYSSSVGIDEKDMYDIFIQEYKGTTVLTKPYTTEFYELLDKSFAEDNKKWRKDNAYRGEDGKWYAKNNKFDNPNYKKIQSTPELKRFYDFHKDKINKAADLLPKKIDPEFIANIKNNTIMDVLKSEGKGFDKLKEGISNITNVDSTIFMEGEFINDEDLFQDTVPLKYLGKLDSKVKSKDLGANLLAFTSFANSYAELNEILPQVRILENEINKRNYKKSSDPSVQIKGEESNLYNMVHTVIDMQIKGIMKKDEFKISSNIYDEEGNKIGEKYIHGSDIIDFGLRYNSLLRIGLNPFNAVTNVLVGDIGNIIEGFGGRFYTTKNLKDATNIFFSQNFKDESELNNWLEKLNPLQELEDYENIDKVSLSKQTNIDTIKNKMYFLQKSGEKFLQTRTMIAILIKDGYMTSDGVTTEKGANLTEKQLAQLSDKIQRVNQMIHGRYSSRDAATIQQSALWRAAFQFKKWIPAAIESRVGSKKYDNRLGAEIEGRYITAYNLLVKDLKGTLNRLQNGQLTELEIYNMRKNLSEIVIALGTLGLFYALGWDDDKKRKQNPHFKYWMNQLDKVSGDLLFFYNPAELNRSFKSPIALQKTLGDLIAVVTNTPYVFGIEGSEYKRGARKGENKFYSSVGDIIPIVKPIADFVRLNNKTEYQEPRKQN